MGILTQRVALLSLAPGPAQSGERGVVLTIRPDRNRLRPQNLAVSRTQAVRLLRSLGSVPHRSASVFLLGLALCSLAGCAAEVHVTTEETAPRTAAAQGAPPATDQRTTTNVAVRLLSGEKPSPAVERSPTKEPAAAPPPEPKKPVEIVGHGNSVTVVEGDLHVHQHQHIHIQEPPRSEHVEIEIRRYEPERDEECERLHREYEQKVRQLKRLFNQ